MNITPLSSTLIDNPQEINSSNVDSRWDNKIIRLATSESYVRFTINALISAGSLGSYMFLSESYPVTSIIYIALSSYSIYIADGLITRIYT